jgi:hypothetical protein
MDAVVATLLNVETIGATELDALLSEFDASTEQPAAG